MDFPPSISPVISQDALIRAIHKDRNIDFYSHCGILQAQGCMEETDSAMNRLVAGVDRAYKSDLIQH